MPKEVDLFSILLVTSQTIPTDHRKTQRAGKVALSFHFLAAFTAGCTHIPTHEYLPTARKKKSQRKCQNALSIYKKSLVA